jgi:hypothetical protein
MWRLNPSSHKIKMIPKIVQSTRYLTLTRPCARGLSSLPGARRISHSLLSTRNGLRLGAAHCGQKTLGGFRRCHFSSQYGAG